MMKIKHAALATALSVFLFSGSAFAQNVASAGALVGALATYEGHTTFDTKKDAFGFAQAMDISTKEISKTARGWVVVFDWGDYTDSQ